MNKTIKSNILFFLLAALAAVSMLIACSASGDDDDDDDTADDDNDDDDTADDDDDDDQASTPPDISDLYTYPDDIPAGGNVNFVVTFYDPDADLIGGQIHSRLDGADQPAVDILHEDRTEGQLISFLTLDAEIASGAHNLDAWITDAAGNDSNTLQTEFQVSQPNHDPVVSNPRFDPNPICNLEGTATKLLIDFVDVDGNLGGGMIVIIIDGQSMNPFLIDPGFEDTEGTLEVDVTLTADAPAEDQAEFSIQVADNLGAMSNEVLATLLIRATACP